VKSTVKTAYAYNNKRLPRQPLYEPVKAYDKAVNRFSSDGKRNGKEGEEESCLKTSGSTERFLPLSGYEPLLRD